MRRCRRRESYRWVNWGLGDSALGSPSGRGGRIINRRGRKGRRGRRKLGRAAEAIPSASFASPAVRNAPPKNLHRPCRRGHHVRGHHLRAWRSQVAATSLDQKISSFTVTLALSVQVSGSYSQVAQGLDRRFPVVVEQPTGIGQCPDDQLSAFPYYRSLSSPAALALIHIVSETSGDLIPKDTVCNQTESIAITADILAARPHSAPSSESIGWRMRLQWQMLTRRRLLCSERFLVVRRPGGWSRRFSSRRLHCI